MNSSPCRHAQRPYEYLIVFTVANGNFYANYILHSSMLFDILTVRLKLFDYTKNVKVILTAPGVEAKWGSEDNFDR